MFYSLQVKMDYKKLGKRNLRRGREFENRVRKELEGKGFIVARWTNNIDLNLKKFIQAKQGKFRKVSTGFPDFIVINGSNSFYFVECKRKGYLDREEKEKVEIIKKMGFRVYLAYLTSKNKRKISYRLLV